MRTLFLFILALMLLASCSTYRATPFMGSFSGHTAHKPIKRMTRIEFVKAESGHSLYVRENGKVYRNTGRQWSIVKKPTYKHRKK